MKLYTPKGKELRTFLKMKLEDSMKYRKKFEQQWRLNEITLLNANGQLGDLAIPTDPTQLGEFLSSSKAQGLIGVNYVFKNWRLIHAQLSANPPTVLARPATSDVEDKERADAADRLNRHAMRKYKLPEYCDLTSATTLTYGTGWAFAGWDEDGGDVLGFDKKSGQVDMMGDFKVRVPSVWNMWIDPFAKCWDDVRYIIERKQLPLDEALAKYPKAKALLHAAVDQANKERDSYNAVKRMDFEEQTVQLFEYWEKGLPINGMQGRYCCFLEDGSPLTEMTASPVVVLPEIHASEIRKAKAKGNTPKEGHGHAVFPFHIFTDIDVCDQVYGKSFIEYEADVQDIINRLDSLELENIQAAGSVKMVLPEGTKVAADSLNNSAYDIVEITGSQPPYWTSAPGQHPNISSFRDRLKQGGDDMAGTNESMFGQQSREQSGFSMQYATNQGNMIRRRLFNKYVMFVEGIYRTYLSTVRQHWEVPRIVRVLGNERAFESVEIKGTDISGGYDLVVEYGASLSLDPTTRREEIMQMMPLFEKAGIDPNTLLGMLKLNELSGMYDLVDLPKLRQLEYFKKIRESHEYHPPKEMEDHKGMLKTCYVYLMTAEFQHLGDDIKLLIEEHVKDREVLAAAAMGTPNPEGANAGDNPPGPDGMPGAAPEAPTAGAPGMEGLDAGAPGIAAAPI